MEVLSGSPDKMHGGPSISDPFPSANNNSHTNRSHAHARSFHKINADNREVPLPVILMFYIQMLDD